MNSQISKNIHKTKDGEAKNHQSFAMELSRLKKAKELCETNNGCEEYNRLGGGERFKEVENLVKTAKEANRKPKEVAMKAGKENAFIKSHEKNRDNANPTAIGGVPKVTKGSVNRKIMTNTEVYNESELPKATSEFGISKITNIDDFKKLIKIVLPENCYLKRFFEPLSRFEITSNYSPNNNVLIYGKNGFITITNSKETKSFNPNEITNISNNLRKMVEYELGACFDTNKINEELSNIKYLIEYMNNNNKKQNL
jgi:hypothetical protein